MVLVGLSRSVSRVPGAEPRTSTPAVAPFSKIRTVHPVGRRESVKCPTRMPCTSVMPPLGFSSDIACRESATLAAHAAAPLPNSRLRIFTLYLATLIASGKLLLDASAALCLRFGARPRIAHLEIRGIRRFNKLRRHRDAAHRPGCHLHT